MLLLLLLIWQLLSARHLLITDSLSHFHHTFEEFMNHLIRQIATRRNWHWEVQIQKISSCVVVVSLMRVKMDRNQSNLMGDREQRKTIRTKYAACYVFMKLQANQSANAAARPNICAISCSCSSPHRRAVKYRDKNHKVLLGTKLLIYASSSYQPQLAGRNIRPALKLASFIITVTNDKWLIFWVKMGAQHSRIRRLARRGAVRLSNHDPRSFCKHFESF